MSSPARTLLATLGVMLGMASGIAGYLVLPDLISTYRIREELEALPHRGESSTSCIEGRCNAKVHLLAGPELDVGVAPSAFDERGVAVRRVGQHAPIVIHCTYNQDGLLQNQSEAFAADALDVVPGEANAIAALRRLARHPSDAVSFLESARRKPHHLHPVPGTNGTEAFLTTATATQCPSSKADVVD